ncbi:MAG: response regulator transcription factor [Pseudomonadales bacterium]|nr:response regulator transcription factor [Pseudomonadales bacterium]MBO6704300.1 response regulator transcription factor [Pseudomonadales bacterium]MBO7005331.1 response regulator transcription factor [Pseudomonadales bacterium]
MAKPDRNTIKRILLVEDHQDAMKVLKVVTGNIFTEAEICSTNTVRSAETLISEEDFDLALLDLGLPDGSGIDLIKLINERQKDTFCVITTIFDDDENLFKALRAGAFGYLLKGYSVMELEKYLKDLLDGRPALSPSIAHRVLQFFRNNPINQQSNRATETLTAREVEILTLVAKGYQTKEVAKLLSISRNTVAHHIKSIYSKLNVQNRAQATAAAMQLKLV